MSDLTYLDHAATTPMRPEVAAAMAAVHAQALGNPTGSHPAAQRARRLLEEARDEVAAFVGCQPGEVVFTSGGTESANLAILGSLSAVARTEEAGPPPLVLHAAVEHPAVLESCRAAAATGMATVRPLPVDPAGLVDLDLLAVQLEEHPALVAIMMANNETGALQPLARVVEMVAAVSPRTTVFSDAVQAAPFLDLRSVGAGVDLIGLSAHKAGGPVGSGVLVIRAPAVVATQLHGGGQERERRSGTQDVAGAVGLATAFRLAAETRAEQGLQVAARRDRLAHGLLAAIEGVHRTVPAGVPTLPGHLHLMFERVEREEVLVALGHRGVCASGGSSCASGALQPSHVLEAMGVPVEWARGAIRFSLGPSTTEAEVATALVVVPEVVAALRRGV